MWLRARTLYVLHGVVQVAELVDVEKGTALVDPLKADGTTPLITAAMMGHADVVCTCCPVSGLCPVLSSCVIELYGGFFV